MYCSPVVLFRFRCKEKVATKTEAGAGLKFVLPRWGGSRRIRELIRRLEGFLTEPGPAPCVFDHSHPLRRSTTYRPCVDSQSSICPTERIVIVADKSAFRC